MSNKNTQNQRVYMLRPASQRRERVTRVTRLVFFTISQLTSKVKSCNQVEREVTEQTESLSETMLKKKKKKKLPVSLSLSAKREEYYRARKTSPTSLYHRHTHYS